MNALILISALFPAADPAVAAKPQTAAATTYQQTVLADKPVGYWRLGESTGKTVANLADASRLTGQISGHVTLGRKGPAAEEFRSFGTHNFAARFHDDGGFIRVEDPGKDSPLDFDTGDSITLEGWVNPETLGEDRYVYLIGKGRTNNRGFARENQNYALRVRGMGGTARVSFLFRNTANRAGNRNDFHRWNSSLGFAPGTGWHHVAVTYTFGKKKSLHAYIDGHEVTGTWDLGGATADGPVVDDDELRIGGSNGLTFRGFLDEVALYRTALSAERIRARFNRIATQPSLAKVKIPDDAVLVEVLERIPDQRSWDFPAFAPPKRIEHYTVPAFAFIDVPQKYNDRGVRADRSNPFVLRATGYVDLPAGKHCLLLRARSASRLYLDGKLIAETPFQILNSSGHDHVPEVESVGDDVRPLQPGDAQELVSIETAGGRHRLRLEIFVGGKKLRPEVGETSLSIEHDAEQFFVLSPTAGFPLTDDGWIAFEEKSREELLRFNARRRKKASTEETRYWHARHQLARKEAGGTAAPKVPKLSDTSTVRNEIDRFINHKLEESGRRPAASIGDMAFLRRVSLDLIGTIPPRDVIDAYINDTGPLRRARLIDRLLEHRGWADNWVGYWQDVLAENPGILKPMLNNTGPFRWWIHESFADNKPFDRFATELVMMEGSRYFGGPAGFAMATQNDAPMAAKAHIVGQAFLGLDMKCARCHDAPFHPFTQTDLLSLAAMLKRGPQEFPKNSNVPSSDPALRSEIVHVSVKPGAKIAPGWTFEKLAPIEFPEGVLRNGTDERERLAALITSPKNGRFARVIVNRMWKRYLGRGIVEPVDDWENAEPAHAELLDWLARELVLNGYDLKHIARLILNSHTYQRKAGVSKPVDSSVPYLFDAPLRRRMSAEQVVDSLLAVAGKQFRVGELNIDIDGRRPYTTFLSLGKPNRAWQFTSLSNERDRPSLALPFAQTIVDVLETFGWRSSRQNPLTDREEEPMVLQPAILANGIVAKRSTQLSDDSAFTNFALEDQTLDEFIDDLFLQILTRKPNADERQTFVGLLKDGYTARKAKLPAGYKPKRRRRPTHVSWSNHLSPEANRIKVEMERLVRQGDPPTERLHADWRERAEDMVWALLNSPEFVFLP